jgi:GntR family transcriptional regulator
VKEDPRVYVQMALDIARQIDRGEIKPGDPVPSITEMSRRYGHARMTCSKALQLLESAGFLMRVPGKSYYVK